MTKSARKILQEARDYLAVPGHWIRSRLHDDGEGVCAAGAVSLCSGMMSRKEVCGRQVTAWQLIVPKEHAQAMEALHEALPSHRVDPFFSVAAFNDFIAKDLNDVLGLFDKAIASLPPDTNIDDLKKLLDTAEDLGGFDYVADLELA